MAEGDSSRFSQEGFLQEPFNAYVEDGLEHSKNNESGSNGTTRKRLISLKVLNSIVLLGKSCQYVKEAKMEEKLFNPPPASTPGKPSTKSQNKGKSSQGLSTEENLSTSTTSQPAHQKENVIPLLVTSNSDQFLTTPDGDEKDITQENSELKHRSSKKDLLEIDRFTICGNRID